MADYIISSGESSNGIILKNNSMTVLDGGTANFTTVNEDGRLHVSSGGTANSTTVNSNAYLYVLSGGTANSTTVNVGGALNLDIHATATDVVENGGYVSYIACRVVTFKAHTFSGLTIDNPSGATVHSGTTAVNTTVVGAYSFLAVYSGGIANGTTVNSGGRMFVEGSTGTANNTTVNSGGTMYVLSGGTANSTTVSGDYSCDMGRMYVDSGGTANSTTVNSRGNLYVISGGTANNTTVNSRGNLYISSGGTATDVVENGGYVYVDEGANVKFKAHTFSGLTLSGTQFATVHSGTTANSTKVKDTGFLTVYSGGIANSTTVDYGGFLEVLSGGTANSTTVSGNYYSSGIMYVDSGGTANSTTVNSNAYLYVSSGGVANCTRVNSGGVMYVSSGGKITGKMTFFQRILAYDPYAVVSVYQGGIVDFDLTGATAGGSAFANNLSVVKGTPTYTLTVNGTQTNGTYKLANGAAGFDKTITVVNTEGTSLGALTVGQTVNIGGTGYTLNLGGDGLLSVSVGAVAPTSKPAKGDVDGNGVSDVMFVWTGYNYAHGYWMNGDANDWRSTYAVHPAEWENLGCYDMNGDGKADSVLVGNIELESGKGAYIGYYLNAEDTDNNWVNIDFLNNEAEVVWKNKVCNLTGNENTNSIIWYAPDMYTVGAWLDGTSQWALLSGNFGGEFWQMVGCGDFDGDGKDSVLMSGGNGQMFYSVGLDGVATSHGEANWAGWEVRAVGDFAGDGRDDIVLFHGTLGVMALLVDGNADDYVSLGQLDPADWFVVGAGDYNNDQKDDLLVRQKTTGMLGYYNACDTSETGWVEMGRGVDLNWTVIA